MEYITVKTSDEKVVKIEKKIAILSSLIMNMIEDVPTTEESVM